MNIVLYILWYFFNIFAVNVIMITSGITILDDDMSFDFGNFCITMFFIIVTNKCTDIYHTNKLREKEEICNES